MTDNAAEPIKAPTYITDIAPYQPGKPISELVREFGLDEANIIKLASNENPLGMSDAARSAMIAALGEIERYPDGNGFELKAAIAERFGVSADQITLGNGSNDILELACRAIVQRGDSVIYSQHSFAVYMLASKAVGAHGIVVPPADNFGHDLVAMAAAVRANTRMLFIANPNNPTGTFVPAAQVKALLEAVPQDVAVVLDQAYDEYLSAQDRYDPVVWLAEHPNLIISRTLSKAYGLAGMRIGFALASEHLTDLMNRVRQPFNTNSLAQAGAVAALNDEAFLARSYQSNLTQRERLQAAFETMGLPYIASRANFVLVNVGDGEKVAGDLLRLGIIIRPVSNYGLPEWVRVSVGLEHENTQFLAKLAQVLKLPAP